jgi:exosome complex component CSL4
LERERKVLPGDRVAVSEEFLPGKNTYESQGEVKASSLGVVEVDKKKREISVKPKVKPKTIEVGDYVVGQVESVQQSLATVKIYYLNEQFFPNSASGLLMIKNVMGKPRNGSLVRLGDIVRCKVISKTNNMLHLSVEDPSSGVLFALCSKCGKKLQQFGNKAKCVECGNIEQRKFARDFGTFESLKP